MVAFGVVIGIFWCLMFFGVRALMKNAKPGTFAFGMHTFPPLILLWPLIVIIAGFLDGETK